MAVFFNTILIGMTLLRIVTVQCDEEIVSMIDKMDGLNKDMIRVEERVVQQIDSAKKALRLELKQHIEEYVEDTIAGVIHGDFSERMVRSHIVTEMKQIKSENRQMKRQLNRMLVSLKVVQEEMKTIQEAVSNSQTDTNIIKECRKCFADLQIPNSVLKQCNTSTEWVNQPTVQKDKEIIGRKQNLMTTMPTPRRVTSTIHSTSVTSLLSVTPKPEEERRRIIIAPVYYPKRYRFRQLNIHSNTITTYRLQRLKRVTFLGYVSKLRKLLIGQRLPFKIKSSTLDSNVLKTMVKSVETYGMAVDEEREIIFVTTTAPRHTISRMTTHGNDFTTIINLTDSFKYPYGIAINTDEEKIYVCNYGKLFTMMYDGRNLQTLVAGTYLFAVTLDTTGRFLYYNEKNTLRKLSLSHNTSETVTQLSVTPWNLISYKDTIYFSDTTIIGGVRLGYDYESYTLQTPKDWKIRSMCIVP